MIQFTVCAQQPSYPGRKRLHPGDYRYSYSGQYWGRHGKLHDGLHSSASPLLHLALTHYMDHRSHSDVSLHFAAKLCAQRGYGDLQKRFAAVTVAA